MAVLQTVLAVLGAIWLAVIATSVTALVIALRGNRATTECPAARPAATGGDRTWLNDQPTEVLTDAEVQRRLDAIEIAEWQNEWRRGR